MHEFEAPFTGRGWLHPWRHGKPAQAAPRLPIGQRYEQPGAELTWNPAEETHLLVLGSAGAGSSDILRSVITAAGASGYDIAVAATGELNIGGGIGTWPGVTAFAGDTLERMTLIQAVHAEFLARSQLLFSRSCRREDFRPLLLVADSWQVAVRAPGADRDRLRRVLGELLGLSRIARIHVAIGIHAGELFDSGWQHRFPATVLLQPDRFQDHVVAPFTAPISTTAFPTASSRRGLGLTNVPEGGPCSAVIESYLSEDPPDYAHFAPDLHSPELAELARRR